MPAKTHFAEPEELMAYLDGELATLRSAEIRTHLEHCADCRESAGNFAALSSRLREWSIVPPNFPAPVLQPDVPRPEAPLPKSENRAGQRRVLTFALVCGGVAILALLLTVPLLRPRHFTDQFEPRAARPEQFAQTNVAPNVLADRVEGKVRAVGTIPMQSPAPLIAHTARILLVAKDFASVEKSIDRIVLQHHGYIAHMTLNAPTGAQHSLEASLRTPDAALDATMADIRALGRVVFETRAGEEVTQQSIDLNARLANARNTEQRLTGLLKERTGKLADVLAVEEQIDNTRGEIERMEAEMKSLADRITYAGLDVSVSEHFEAAFNSTGTPWPTQLRNAAIEGLTGLQETALGILTFAFARVPSLLLWLAILFFPIRYLWRRFGPVSLSWWKHDQ